MTRYKIKLSETRFVLNDFTGKPRLFKKEVAEKYGQLSRFNLFYVVAEKENPS